MGVTAVSTRSFTDVHVHLENPADESTEFTVEQANDALAVAVDAAAGSTLDGTVDKVLLTMPPLAPSNAGVYRTGFREFDEYAAGEDSAGADSIIAGIVVGGRRINLILQAHGAATDDATREDLVAALERTLSVDPTGVMASQVAIGEIAILHVSADNDQNPFIQIDPASEPMLMLLDFAGVYGLPIDIHMEIVPFDVDTVDIEVTDQFGQPIIALYDTSLGDANVNPATLERNVEAFEALLEQAEDCGAKIVLEHVGQAMIMREWFFEKMAFEGRTCDINNSAVQLDEDWLPAWLADLLSKYPDTLYIALKWNEGDPYQMRSLFEDGTWGTDGSGAETVVDLAIRRLRASWAALFEAWPDNFVMGSDQFLSSNPEQVSPEGNMATTMELVEVIARNLDALGADGQAIADRFASGNAAELYRLA